MPADNTQPIKDLKLDQVPSEYAITDQAEVLETETIRLLEEQLVVKRSKHKVGEVIVRKQVETRIVEVPVRSEKLIVEQVTPEKKQIAEIKLSEGVVAGDTDYLSSSNPGTVKGEFFSLSAASSLLEAIASQRPHGCKKVRIELVLEDESRQSTYQEMFDRCTRRSS